MTSSAGDELRLGFLTTRDVDQKGIVGGLLITNRFGRPLEFQCTVPIKASRTQEILYGQTLDPYLKCDLIGRTLFEKVSVKPHLLITADAQLLELRQQLTVPVVCCRDVSAEASTPVAASDLRIGDQIVSFHAAHAGDAAIVEQRVASLPADADLFEPLERVREALAETTRSAA